MRRSAGRLVSCALGFAFLAGCVSPIRYSQDRRPFVDLGGDRYLVRSFGTDMAACKAKGLNRSAKLCLDKGFRFFLIEDEQVISGFVAIHQASSSASFPDQDWERRPDPDQAPAGLQRGPDIGFRYTLHFFKQRPNSLARDAEDFRDQVKGDSSASH